MDVNGDRNIYRIHNYTLNMQTVEYHIKLPKHLSVRLEDQIIERYGYKARGGITLLILEALEEKLNPNKSNKLKSEKNGLAPKSLGDEKRVNNKNLNVASDISIILPDIKTQMIKTADDNDDAYYIPENILINIITRRLGITEKRGHKNKIDWMVAHGLLTPWQEYKSVGYKKDGLPNPPKLINHYFVNPEFLGADLPILK